MGSESYDYEKMLKVPGLYDTENTPFDEKTIYQKWVHPYAGSYWLIAEYDPKWELAFGYTSPNDEEIAEWGFFSLEELLEVGALPMEDWEPRKFREIGGYGYQ